MRRPPPASPDRARERSADRTRAPLDVEDARDRDAVESVRAQTVDRLGGKGDDAALAQDRTAPRCRPLDRHYRHESLAAGSPTPAARSPGRDAARARTIDLSSMGDLGRVRTFYRLPTSLRRSASARVDRLRRRAATARRAAPLPSAAPGEAGQAFHAHRRSSIQENRTFDNLFATFPGADGATVGRRITARCALRQGQPRELRFRRTTAISYWLRDSITAR